MAIKSDDLMRLAREQSRNAGEPWWRSAISRAYYASYHRCLQWELALPHRGTAVPRGRGVHRQLIDRLNAPVSACTLEQVKKSKDLGRLMHLQRERRVAADYRLSDDVGIEQMKQQMRDARQVFRACRR
ncbi:hypothetical protein [Roseateles aquatilis]|uniref:hypothetical protein n=1 Tax=Roseateles aquatilis TaxID=431061 RepID=UPI00113231AD|nr:hypothetical protein [Roseateles aquatilis]